MSGKLHEKPGQRLPSAATSAQSAISNPPRSNRDPDSRPAYPYPGWSHISSGYNVPLPLPSSIPTPLPVGVVPTTVNSPTTAELALFVGRNSISKNLRIPKSLHRQRGRCHHAYCRGQRLLHQIFYPRPQMGVALALGVSRSDEAVIPRQVLALHRIFSIVEPVVAQNLRFSGIGGHNLRPAFDDSMGLVEVDRSRHVVWNDAVFLPDLGHAIDLHGEQHGNSDALQIASQEHDRRSSPAVAE